MIRPTDVEPWPEADALFRSDPRWLGGDDAYSVPLGGARHLWLFGDTLIRREEGGGRRGSHFINNTIGIQTGDDPTTASMAFHWRGTPSAPVSMFVEEDPDVHLWPGGAVLQDDVLVLFFMRVGSGMPAEDEGVDTIDIAGWRVALVTDVDADPSAWVPRWLPLVDVPFAQMVGAGGVFVEGSHLYAHGHPAPEASSTGSFLARWPLADVLRGDLDDLTWLVDGSWVPTTDVAGLPDVVIEPPLTEFTVHPEEQGWVATQLLDLETGELALRTAAHPTTGWSDPTVVHRSPLVGRDDEDVIAYAGKSHPAVGDDRGHLVTYCSNTRTLGTIYDRMDVYFPHCLHRTTADAPRT